MLVSGKDVACYNFLHTVMTQINKADKLKACAKLTLYLELVKSNLAHRNLSAIMEFIFSFVK